jgi:hypothetical protein
MLTSDLRAGMTLQLTGFALLVLVR